MQLGKELDKNKVVWAPQLMKFPHPDTFPRECVDQTILQLWISLEFAER